jgi:hypothetical protein
MSLLSNVFGAFGELTVKRLDDLCKQEGILLGHDGENRIVVLNSSEIGLDRVDTLITQVSREAYWTPQRRLVHDQGLKIVIDLVAPRADSTILSAETAMKPFPKLFQQ